MNPSDRQFCWSSTTPCPHMLHCATMIVTGNILHCRNSAARQYSTNTQIHRIYIFVNSVQYFLSHCYVSNKVLLHHLANVPIIAFSFYTVCASLSFIISCVHKFFFFSYTYVFFFLRPVFPQCALQLLIISSNIYTLTKVSPLFLFL